MYQFFRGYSQLLATQSAQRNLKDYAENKELISNEISSVQFALVEINKRMGLMNEIMDSLQDKTKITNSPGYANQIFRRYAYDYQRDVSEMSHAEFLNRYCYDFGFTIELAGRYLPRLASFAESPVLGYDQIKIHNMQLFGEVQTHIKAIKDRRDFAYLSANLLKIKPELTDESFATCRRIVAEMKSMISNYNYVKLARLRGNSLTSQKNSIETYKDVPDDYFLSQIFAIKYGLDLNFNKVTDIRAYCRSLDPMKSIPDAKGLPFDFLSFPPKLLAMARNETLTGCDVLTVITSGINGEDPIIDCLPNELKSSKESITENLLSLAVRV